MSAIHEVCYNFMQRLTWSLLVLEVHSRSNSCILSIDNDERLWPRFTSLISEFDVFFFDSKCKYKRKRCDRCKNNKKKGVHM